MYLADKIQINKEDNMWPVENTKIEDRKLILLARYAPGYARDILIPEIEANSIQYHVNPMLVESFQRHKFAKGSLYFHHNRVYADIPTGQEYEIAARIYKGVIVPDSIVEIKATVLNFFTTFRIYPAEYANHGCHENCLIQFHDGIPDMINELYEIAEKKPMEMKQEICLCSYQTLKANVSFGEAYKSY